MASARKNQPGELVHVPLITNELLAAQMLTFLLLVALLWTFYYCMRIMAAMQTCNCIHVQVC